MTQAAEFLGEILDDSIFQIDGNAAARNFWYGVCAVIGIAAFFNFAQKVTAFSRLRSAASNRPHPASPSNFLTISLATVTAIGREASYPQFMPQNGIVANLFKIPPMGTIILLVAYLVPTATLTTLEGGVTRVCIDSKSIKKWTPGSHVLLSVPVIGILQSHPATIASIPSSHGGKLVFLLKGHKGFTGRLITAAETSPGSRPTWKARIDGPYGNTADYATFDTVLLISGSTVVDSDTDSDEITSIDEKGTKITSRPKATSASSVNSGTRSSVLPCAVFHSGRPDFHPLIGELLEKAEGETGIAVCGPLGLNSKVRDYGGQV
ncbi:hypothetical protein EYC84_010039 [Monilinia fructicola]|uniref:ferric-chelate reductase (NADPH) n=1 Tax=Monilinia fructicola TaxID=38448 RepID=A0A5M9JF41_MONFR|nr:hypothetical protein EYC84_010039 [Monilinia fructicola]